MVLHAQAAAAILVLQRAAAVHAYASAFDQPRTDAAALSCFCFCQGVGNTAAAAKDAGVQRVVLVSSMLTHPSNRWVAHIWTGCISHTSIAAVIVQYNSIMMAVAAALQWLSRV
jgi:hypothetical protein